MKDDKLDSKKLMQYFEEGNSRDLISAIKPFVEKNDSEAITWLGSCYDLGFGVPHDPLKALELYKKAYKLGSGLAAHNLGTLYLSGLPDIHKNKKLSKFYYRKAKEMGAQFARDDFYN